MCIGANQEARPQSQNTERNVKLEKQWVQAVASSFPDPSENSNLYFSSEAKEEKKASSCPSLTTLEERVPCSYPNW